MQGRAFLDLAREVVRGGTPRHRRGAIIHSYYAPLLECREAMDRLGFPPLSRQQVHAQIRLRLVYATDRDTKRIGMALERLGQDRNLANYDLRDLQMFGTDRDARDAIQAASDFIALLEAIDADPVRRAAAMASIKP